MTETSRDSVAELRLNATPAAMQAVLDEVQRGSFDEARVAALALVLGRSGAIIEHSPGDSTADLASTGGPTSLSTLLGPLYFRALGYRVPKLGVMGRPAGGIDVLAQVPGYRVNLSCAEVRAVLEDCGYAHFLAGPEHAPLDARFFRYRQEVGAQSVPDLVIASLLAKKIAAGVQQLCLDIRVAPHGNFGENTDVARNNAKRFSTVAELLGVSATCFLTDARYPYQPYIGRGESLVGVSEVLAGCATPALQKHAATCLAMVSSTGGSQYTDGVIGRADVAQVFIANLKAQGSSHDAFQERVHAVQRAHRFTLCALRNGRVTVHLGGIRSIVGEFQRRHDSPDAAFPDGMGIVLLKIPGDPVVRGDAIATVRVPEVAWPQARVRLSNVITVGEDRPARFALERV